MNTILSRTTVKNYVEEITNRVPRELVKLSDKFNRFSNSNISDDEIIVFLKQFEEDRRLEFFKIAESYFFHNLNTIQRYSQRHVLAPPRKLGEIEYDREGYNYQFVDLGLVYRIEIRGHVQYYPLCSAAKLALLQIYKSIPLPQYKAI